MIFARIWRLICLWLLIALSALGAEEVRIRVLFVATTSPAVQGINALGGINNVAAHYLNTAQQALRNSGINNIRLELADTANWNKFVYRDPVLGEEGAGMIQDLTLLAGGIPSIEAEKKRTNADLVVPICYEGEHCLGMSRGALLHPDENGEVDISAASRYIAIDIRALHQNRGNEINTLSTTHTFIHELGHCFGCGHADTQGGEGGAAAGPQTTPYSCGLQSKDSFSDQAHSNMVRSALSLPNIGIGHRTIMAYEGRLDSSGNLIPEYYALTKHPCFSHPGRDSLLGGTDQTYSTGDTDRHNNARVIRENAHRLARKIPYENTTPQTAYFISNKHFTRISGDGEEVFLAKIEDSNTFVTPNDTSSLPQGDDATPGALGVSLWYLFRAKQDAEVKMATIDLNKSKVLFAYKANGNTPSKLLGVFDAAQDTDNPLSVKVKKGDNILLRVDTRRGAQPGPFTMLLGLDTPRVLAPAPGRGSVPGQGSGTDEQSGSIGILVLCIFFLGAAVLIFRSSKKEASVACAGAPAMPPPSVSPTFPHPHPQPPRIPGGNSPHPVQVPYGPPTPPIPPPAPLPPPPIQPVLTPSGIYHLLVQYSGGQRKKFAFSEDELFRMGAITVGSADDNHIVIKNFSVSRHHASFKMKPDGLQIKDLGSTNGTYLPLQRIRLHKNEGAILNSRDTIVLGEVTIEIY